MERVVDKFCSSAIERIIRERGFMPLQCHGDEHTSIRCHTFGSCAELFEEKVTENIGCVNVSPTEILLDVLFECVNSLC